MNEEQDIKSSYYPEHSYQFSLWTRAIARFVSILFHPLLIVPYAYLLAILVNPYSFKVRGFDLFWQNPTQSSIFRFLIIYILVIPLCGMVIMRGLGLIRDLRLQERMDRIGPYILTGTFYITSYVTLPWDRLPLKMELFVLGATIALFIAFFINLFSKISIHAVGMGNFLAMLLIISQSATFATQTTFQYFVENYLFLLGIIACGLVGASRRILSDHLPADIYGGYFIGFLSILMAYNFVYM
ncbi:MAG: hypothetical protein MK212_16795 [Saprospiraceae bacterium]|nr:hypothetical protein [Saprospiraceae bacterium]